MNNLWDNSGVPHKGWTLVDVQDLREDGTSPEDTAYATCEMCGQERIRFVHMMEHPGYQNLQVGCICAEKMSGDYQNPRRLETKLRNRAARKTKWLKRRWRTSAKGNPYINADGHNIGVLPSPSRPGRWKFRIDGNFSNQSYPTVEEAKLALFDAFWTVLEEKDDSAL